MYKILINLIIWSNFLIGTLLAAGITLTVYPSNPILINSLQNIAWTVPDGVILAITKIDIYQNSQFAQTLGMTNNNAKSFQWMVSKNARIANNYAIRVTATSTQGKTAWATSPLFSIISDNHHTNSALSLVTIVFITIICLLLMLLMGCCHRKYKSRLALRKMDTNSSDYYTMNPPPVGANDGYPANGNTTYTHPQVAQVAQGVPNTTYPSAYVVNPTRVVTNERSGYSGGSVAGAALAGMVGGVLLDEALSNRHSHHGNHGNHGNVDFGGGTFGDGGDFGDGGNGGGDGDFGGSF